MLVAVARPSHMANKRHSAWRWTVPQRGFVLKGKERAESTREQRGSGAACSAVGLLRADERAARP